MGDNEDSGKKKSDQSEGNEKIMEIDEREIPTENADSQQNIGPATEPVDDVDQLNSSVQKCRIQPDQSDNENMETEEHQMDKSKETMETEMKKSKNVENMETEGNTSRPKQNADILLAKPHMPIKKEITEENLKKEDNDSDSDESESSTDENYQKVINNDDWDINMQRKIDEAYASTEMPAQLDQRFVKQPQEASKVDVEMKDIEKSKHGSIDESTSNQEEEMGSDVSLNDDEFNNLLKELETHDPEDLTEEMKAKLAEAQKLKKEKNRKIS